MGISTRQATQLTNASLERNLRFWHAADGNLGVGFVKIAINKVADFKRRDDSISYTVTGID